MSDTVKLIIEIPKDYYEIIKHDVENHLTDYRLFEIIGNGIPLDDIKAEIQAEYGHVHNHISEGYTRYDDGRLDELEWVLDVLDNIGKAEMRGKSCNTCKNNDDEFSGECYECLKGIFDHYEPEEDKPQESEDNE